MMNSYLYLLPLLILLGACGETSPVNSDPEDHQEVVDRSRREGTIVISLDTIFNAGVPYAVMTSDPVMLPGRASGAGSNVWLLAGPKAIHITPIILYGNHYLQYRLDDGRFVGMAYIEYRANLLDDAKLIVGSGLLTRDEIDSSNARAFVLSNPKPEYRPPVRGANVVRDMNQPILVDNGEIWQTGVRIGRYDTTGFMIAGFPVTQVNIYYVDTVHCATVTHGTKPADSVASVFTARDKRTRDVKRDQSNSLLSTVLGYLVGAGYL